MHGDGDGGRRYFVKPAPTLRRNKGDRFVMGKFYIPKTSNLSHLPLCPGVLCPSKTYTGSYETNNAAFY
jgi:hypothetical protein